MHKILFSLIFILSIPLIALACSMIRAPDFPFSSVHPELYVIEGEVIGYTEKIKAKVKSDGFTSDDNFFGEGRGLKVKPVKIISAPVKSLEDYFEIYTFGVTPWCAPNLQEMNLSVGTKIRFAATEATLLPNRNKDNKVRMQSKIFDRFSIINNEDEFESNAGFDYEKNWKSTLEKLSAEKNYEQLRRFDDFLYVQTVEDILNLKTVRTKGQKLELLERLLYNPKVDFPALVSTQLSANPLQRLKLSTLKYSDKNRIKLTKQEQKLIEKRRDLEKSGYFQIK